MNGKPVLERPARSVLNISDPFAHKLLCDGLTLNLGDACAYSCTFCYVPSMMLKVVYELLNGMKGEDVVIRRANALEILERQLKNAKGEPRFKNAEDTRVVFSSTTVDVAANMELAKESAAAFTMILENTNWQIRVLSKSNLLPFLVSLIPSKYYNRLILGVSTGTLDDKTAQAIEVGTPLVSKRIASLHKLQDAGLRTFGMICPSLPMRNYPKFSKEICDAIRVDKCEHVWAEVINLRGESLVRTLEGLKSAGLSTEAELMAEVMGAGNKSDWEMYARMTFLAHTRNVPPGKLRFLQYVTDSTRVWWKDYEKRGAVLL